MRNYNPGGYPFYRGISYNPSNGFIYVAAASVNLKEIQLFNLDLFGQSQSPNHRTNYMWEQTGELYLCIRMKYSLIGLMGVMETVTMWVQYYLIQMVKWRPFFLIKQKIISFLSWWFIYWEKYNNPWLFSYYWFWFKRPIYLNFRKWNQYLELKEKKKHPNSFIF